MFVAAYPLSALDTKMARVIAPIERLFGVVLLGTATARGIAHFNDTNGGGTGTSFP